MKNKFEAFNEKELLEILAAFQGCSRNSKLFCALFAQLEQELHKRWGVGV